MKHISITIALALICTMVNAQNITGSHQVRVNDEVKHRSGDGSLIYGKNAGGIPYQLLIKEM